ncbi:MAG: Rrf2 family transcriptional regulator [Oscillospiraceae bacterium]|nr:Rrf2 family transcriptional regulator [Oscillospiraceae bacterium]
MMVSTKGRYALRVMIDLAQQKSQTYIPLTDVAERQEISEKYLESIVSALSKKGLLDSIRGKGGGYKLNRSAEEYTVAEILRATEGSMAPVACLGKEENDCPRKDDCKTLKMWKKVYEVTEDFFKGVTVRDLVNGKEL